MYLLFIIIYLFYSCLLRLRGRLWIHPGNIFRKSFREVRFCTLVSETMLTIEATLSMRKRGGVTAGQSQSTSCQEDNTHGKKRQRRLLVFWLPGGNVSAPLWSIGLFSLAIGSYGGHLLSFVSSASRLESGLSSACV